ncbi:hypothetical protein [Croceimicrobium sp.]|uniref:hypothetical protein n=1 Tax=Croceimicrobium sp. TaxID=2828340 RepID=UPI003BA90894
MKLRSLLFVLFINLLAQEIVAQVAVAYYPFQSTLSVSTDTEKPLWADFRIETNSFYGNLNSELDLMWNWKRGEWVNYYSGVGWNFAPFAAASDLDFTNGYLFATGARIKPWTAHRNFQVILEIAPYVNRQWDGGIFRSSLGLAYNW